MPEPALSITPNEKVVEGLRGRDPGVLDWLVAEHGDDLRRYLRALTKDRHRAEDLFQETWLRVFERGHQYSGEFPFKTWLFGIARHLLIDQLRRRQPISLEELLEASGPHREPASHSAPSPFEEACRQEQSERLKNQIHKLAPDSQHIVCLRLHDDRPLAEIAAMTATPLCKVKRRLYRSLETLQTRLVPRSGRGASQSEPVRVGA